MSRGSQTTGYRETPDPGAAPDAVLGRGRSGIVVRRRDARGREVARKIFVGDRASTVVHYLIYGAPSAYVWNADAVRCALARRRILVDLVEYWFESKLRVATAHDVGWSDDTRSFFLDTEFVEGRAPALHHPFSESSEGQTKDLVSHVMRPLQTRLAEAGLDGLVWQAGRGNPVAANNFLRLQASDDESEWAWIDLESGIPALVPINPLDLLRFYLPKSWRHRRALFDDVDIDKLRRYTSERHQELVGAIGGERLAAMQEHIGRLEAHQQAWRSLPRVLRSITYRLGKGRITQQQAEWYRERPFRWYALELRLGLAAGVRHLLRLLRRVARAIAQFDYRRALLATWRYTISQRYRSGLAHDYVTLRIDRWQDRGQLSAAEAGYLRETLGHEMVGSYITDFGVHIAIKPPIKLLQWGIVPALFASGWIGPATMALLITTGGAIGRTLYTLGRMIMAASQGERLPWIALAAGLLPVFGNVAYPLQLAYLSTERRGKLAGFIIYDSTTAVGELLPIWGGRDTATEHWMNRMTDFIVRDRRALPGDPGTADQLRIEKATLSAKGHPGIGRVRSRTER